MPMNLQDTWRTLARALDGVKEWIRKVDLFHCRPLPPRTSDCRQFKHRLPLDGRLSVSGEVDGRFELSLPSSHGRTARASSRQARTLRHGGFGHLLDRELQDRQCEIVRLRELA